MLFNPLLQLWIPSPVQINDLCNIQQEGRNKRLRRSTTAIIISISSFSTRVSEHTQKGVMFVYTQTDYDYYVVLLIVIAIAPRLESKEGDRLYIMNSKVIRVLSCEILREKTDFGERKQSVFWFVEAHAWSSSATTTGALIATTTMMMMHIMHANIFMCTFFTSSQHTTIYWRGRKNTGFIEI